MAKKKIWYLISAFVLAILCLTVPVLAVGTSDSLPVSSSGTSLFSDSSFDQNSVLGRFPVENYTFDANGVTGSLNPIYHVANFLFYLAILLLRFAISLMSFGFHPPELTSLIGGIIKIINGVKENVLLPLLPLISLVLFIMLMVDFIRRNYARAMSRFMKVLFMIVAIVVYSTMSTSFVTTLVDATNSISESLANLTMSAAHATTGKINKDIAAQSTSMEEQVWNEIALYPFVVGEMGGNLAVNKNDIENVKSSVDHPEWLSNPPAWYEALLQYPVDNSKRNTLAAILNSDTYPIAQQGFAVTNRLTITFVTVISAGGPILFMALFGGLSFFFHLFFLIGLLLGIFVLAAELMPVNTSKKGILWLIKILLGCLVGSILLGLYVSLVMVVVYLIQTFIDASHWPAALAILLNGLWYYGAIWLFFWLIKKFDPISKFNAAVSQNIGSKIGAKHTSGATRRNRNQTGRRSSLSPNIRSKFRSGGPRNSRSTTPSGLRSTNQSSNETAATTETVRNRPKGSFLDRIRQNNTTTFPNGRRITRNFGTPGARYLVTRKSNAEDDSAVSNRKLPKLQRNLGQLGARFRMKQRTTQPQGIQIHRGTSHHIVQRHMSQPGARFRMQRRATQPQGIQIRRGTSHHTVQRHMSQPGARFKITRHRPEVQNSSPRMARTLAARSMRWIDKKATERNQKTIEQLKALRNVAPAAARQAPRVMKKMFHEIKNSRDAHAITRIVLDASETITKGAARQTGKIAVESVVAAPAIAYATGKQIAETVRKAQIGSTMTRIQAGRTMQNAKNHVTKVPAMIKNSSVATHSYVREKMSEARKQINKITKPRIKRK